MSVKEIVGNMLETLPDNITWDEFLYRLYVIEKVERSDREFEEGDWVSHEDVEKITEKWFE